MMVVMTSRYETRAWEEAKDYLSGRDSRRNTAEKG
jgi:hypothetical protein